MVDIHDVLAGHKSRSIPKSEDVQPISKNNNSIATTSKIPDLFFDDILVDFKLTRIEIIVLMHLYRRVWCRPNPYKEYGISQLLSHQDMGKSLKISLDEIYHALRKLEELNFISTIRSGQYFVRKYFTKEYDELLSQTYNEFDF